VLGSCDCLLCSSQEFQDSDGCSFSARYLWILCPTNFHYHVSGTIKADEESSNRDRTTMWVSETQMIASGSYLLTTALVYPTWTGGLDIPVVLYDWSSAHGAYELMWPRGKCAVNGIRFRLEES
jgi:hypothetical protein